MRNLICAWTNSQTSSFSSQINLASAETKFNYAKALTLELCKGLQIQKSQYQEFISAAEWQYWGRILIQFISCWLFNTSMQLVDLIKISMELVNRHLTTKSIFMKSLVPESCPFFSFSAPVSPSILGSHSVHDLSILTIHFTWNIKSKFSHYHQLCWPDI